MPFDTKSDKFSESAELFSHTLLCLGGIYCWSMMMIWNMRPSLPVPGSPLRDNWLEWGPRADGGRGLKFGQETSLLQTIMMTICNAMNSPPQNGRQENFGHKRNLYFFLHNPRPGKPTLKVRLRLIFCRATHRIFHFCKNFSQNFTLLFCRHAIWEYFDRNSLRHCSTVNQDCHCNNRIWSSELRHLQGMSNSLDTFLLKTFMWVYDPDQVISFNIGE